MYEGKGNQVTGALTRSKFSASVEPVQKALQRLEEAVDHIYNQFAPILGPDRPTSCANEKVDAPQCDYEHFVSSTCAKIHAACERIDLVCDRSVI
jgi:hypothetical protein